MSAPPWLLTAALASLSIAPASGLFEKGLRPLPQVRAPARIGSLSASACGSCHAAAYQEWKGSRHRQSFTNRIFGVSYRDEPMPWCVYCHAPLPEQAAVLGLDRSASAVSALLSEGINCAVCHVRDGFILSARAPSAAGRKAHPMREERQLGRPEFCGGCHQFNVPRDSPPLRYTDEPMQNTLVEWQRSDAAHEGRSCQHCHMTGGAHRFPGAHDPEFLKRSIGVRVRRTEEGIAVTLSARRVGHNLPTGDPFRRLELHFCREPRCVEPLGKLAFARVFQKLEDGSRLASDWTLPPSQGGRDGERSLIVREFGPEATSYRLVYAYAARGAEGSLTKAERELELVRGTIEKGPER